VISNSQFFQISTKVVHGLYEKQVRKMPLLYTELYNQVEPDSDRPFITFAPIVGLSTFGLQVEGAPPTFDKAEELLPSTFVFVSYGLAYRITDEGRMETAKVALSRLPRMLAYSEQITKELLLWNIFNFAFDSTVLLPDGQPLCSTAHPLLKEPGVTVSNSGGTLALSPEALQNAFIHFMTLVDDRGIPIYRTPQDLWVPPSLQKPAEEILGSTHYPFSSENRVNIQEGRLRLHVIRYITSPTQWMITAGKGSLEGDTHSIIVSFKYQNRHHSWLDDATDTFNHKSKFRLAYGAVDWRGVWGSQGS
jgi:hypothetical protein